jgi:hypothetical protein
MQPAMPLASLMSSAPCPTNLSCHPAHVFPMNEVDKNGEPAGTLFFLFLFLSAFGFFFSRLLRNGRSPSERVDVAHAQSTF